jgi:hypothetical protein
MCTAKAVTKEHVPPKSFFPPDKRQKLFTVPSCWRHNNDNSEDVAYVRNIIALDINTNDTARLISNNKAIPSLKRDRRLRRKTLSLIRTMKVEGGETGVLHADMRTYKKIMRGIAYALHYTDFGTRYPYFWGIYSSTMIAAAEDKHGLHKLYNAQIDGRFIRLAATDRDTNYPEVFKYAVFRVDENKLIYKFEFYEGVLVYAIGGPDRNLLRL